MDLIVITESQLKYLIEIAVESPFEPHEILSNKIYRRCAIAKQKKYENSPWCKLSFVYKTQLDETLQKRLDTAIDELFKVYKKNYNKGVLPAIINLALQDRSKTVSNLETIVRFLQNPEYNNDSVKRQLLKLSGLREMPNEEDLEKLLKSARYKEYINYENSLTGNQFKPKKTYLKFEHRCEEEMDDKFFNLIQDVKVNNKDITNFISSFTKCIKSSMDSISNPIKADAELIQDLYVIEKDSQGNETKKMVLPKGYYEIKKFDPMVDSYLSEFFSVFKESGLKEFKTPENLKFYNNIVQVIFEWIQKNDGGYLDRVRQNMSGIIFDKNIIVPMKYIELYWSNRGQSSCKEKRISIRFRLKPNIMNDVELYRYKYNSNVVEKIPLSNFNLESLKGEKEICL